MLFDEQWIKNSNVVNPITRNIPYISHIDFKIVNASIGEETERPILSANIWFSDTNDMSFPDDIAYFPNVKLNGEEKWQRFSMEVEQDDSKEIFVFDFKTVDHHNGQYELYNRFSSIQMTS